MKIMLALLLLMVISPDIYAEEENDELSIMCSKYKSIQVDGAQYIAGVDIHGNEVVSADLESKSANILVDPIIIPLRIDLAERFGLDLTKGAIAEPIVSNIEVYADGSVKYNGIDISDNIKKLCDGQEEGYPVPSSDKNN